MTRLLILFALLSPTLAHAEQPPPPLEASCRSVLDAAAADHGLYRCVVQRPGRSPVAVLPSALRVQPGPKLVPVLVRTNADYPGLTACERWPRRADGECRPSSPLAAFAPCRRPGDSRARCPRAVRVMRWVSRPIVDSARP